MSGAKLPSARHRLRCGWRVDNHAAAGPGRQAVVMNAPPKLDAVLFDVFGTVVDWRSAIISHGAALAAAHHLEVDWPSFADRWRHQGYLEPIGRMVTGEQPWTPIDTALRHQLGVLADEYSFAGVGIAALDDMGRVWERLQPWPDVREGLDRLRSRYPIGPLSNGTFASLVRMSRHAGLRWDCILAAELFGAYKPDPRVYSGAVTLLGLEPARVMLVAAHPLDLRAARRCGLLTAYIPRPLEWGPDSPPPPPADPETNVVAEDFAGLAEALGA